jgi:3-dehydro-scyllo-inosose hydrolase
MTINGTNAAVPPGLLETNQPDLYFEDNAVGRLKHELWHADVDGINRILSEYGYPAPVEWGVAGSYLQMMPRAQLIEERRRNDIVFVPFGSTENHGRHLPSAADTLFASQIVEGVRRFIKARDGAPPALCLPPLTVGAHPYHHFGMPGTVIIRDDIVREALIDVMLGLYNDGYRKIVVVNNHGQLWVLESAIQEFARRYQLPGIFRVLDWHRSVREFFREKKFGGEYDSTFVHACEAETSFGLYLFPEMVDMSEAVNTEGRAYLPEGHFDKSVEPYRRPSRFSEGEGHFPIELWATPEGVVGLAAEASAEKAKRPLAAILRYLTLLHDDILEAFPAGAVPPVEEVTLRRESELEPYLREPQSPGWRSVYALPRIGQSSTY